MDGGPGVARFPAELGRTVYRDQNIIDETGFQLTIVFLFPIAYNVEKFVGSVVCSRHDRTVVVRNELGGTC